MGKLELLASYLRPISEILLGILAIYGTYLTVKIHKFTEKSGTVNKLAHQVLAYNCLEQELLKELSDKTGAPVPTLQKEMRQRAVNNEKNIGATYPDMTPSQAKQFINN